MLHTPGQGHAKKGDPASRFLSMDSEEHEGSTMAPPAFSLLSSSDAPPPPSANAEGESSHAQIHGVAQLKVDGDDDAQKLYKAMKGLGTDEDAIFQVLAGKSTDQLRAIRSAFKGLAQAELETWLQSELGGGDFKRAMAYLQPAIPIYDRLQLHYSIWGDNEGAMVEIIKTADQKALDEARRDSRVRDFLYGNLDHDEMYAVSMILWPEQRLDNVVQLIKDSKSIWGDDEQAVYMAVMDLGPAERKRLWEEHRSIFSFLGGYQDKDGDIKDQTEFGRLRKMLLGSAADMLKAGMEAATDGLGTSDELVKKLTTSAKESLDAEGRIKAQLDKGVNAEGQPLSPEHRLLLEKELAKLGGVGENILKAPSTEEGSFLSLLLGDVSQGEFEQFSQEMGVDDFVRAKQMILAAPGFWNDDEDAIHRALASIQNPDLRKRLWEDSEVQVALKDAFNETELTHAAHYRDGDTYAVSLQKLKACDGFFDDDEAGAFNILLGMSPDDRKRLNEERPADFLEIYDDLTADEKLAVEEILTTGRLSADKALKYAGGGAGTDEDFINKTLDRMDQATRFQIRVGYALASGHAVPETLVSKDEQEAARAAYEQLRSTLEGELGTDDLNIAMDHALGAPTLNEYTQDGGWEMMMFIMNQRVMEKGEGHSGGFGDWFVGLYSETGGISDEVETAARSAYLLALQNGEISQEELAIMGFLEQEFSQKHQEYVDAADTVADIASTVAAVVVAAIAILATGGTDAPAVVPALAAYLGISETAAAAIVVGGASGMAKLVTKEAIGGEHNDMGATGAQDFAVGTVDGMMMVLTGGVAKSLQLSFFRMIGVKGAQLTTEMTIATLRATEIGVSQMGKRFAVGGIRAGIEGMLSGAAGELVFTAMDEETWRRGIWNTITAFGSALMRGMAMGGAAGFLTGGIMESLSSIRGSAKAKNLFNRLVDSGFGMERMDRLNLEQISLVAEIDKAIDLDDWATVEAKLQTLAGKMEPGEFERMRRGLLAGKGPQRENPLELAGQYKYGGKYMRQVDSNPAIWEDAKWVREGGEAVTDEGPKAIIEGVRKELLSSNRDVKIARRSLQKFGVELSDADVQSIKYYLFGEDTAISMNRENYTAWRRLTAGGGENATLDDARFLVHENHEIHRMRELGKGIKFDPTGRAGNMSRSQFQHHFNQLYEVAHKEALEAEYKFLAGKLEELTGERYSIGLLAVADCNRLRDGVPPLYNRIDPEDFIHNRPNVDGLPLHRHPAFASWEQRAQELVHISAGLAKQLNLPREVPLFQLVAAIKRLKG
jgi:hypothetical protein